MLPYVNYLQKIVSEAKVLHYRTILLARVLYHHLRGILCKQQTACKLQMLLTGICPFRPQAQTVFKTGSDLTDVLKGYIS